MKTPFPIVLLSCLVSLSLLAEQDPEVSLQEGNSLVSLEISNTTKGAVVVAWVDFEGQMKSYGTLQPGQMVVLQTYPGHLWKFGAGQQLIGRYRASAAPQQKFALTPGSRVQPANPAPKPNSNLSHGETPQMQKPASGATPPSGGGTQGGGKAITNTGPRLSVADAQQLLQYHNQARREVRVPDVTWSPEIAAFAQQWADEMARTGRFAHRPNDQQRYGENLATGTTGAFTVVQLAKQWYDEKPLYRPGTAFTMATMPAGHYTQMVWNKTTMIGAGIAVCQTGQLRGMAILVCNYAPRGNMIGQRPY